MATFSEEELAMLTEEERAGILEDEDEGDDNGEDNLPADDTPADDNPADDAPADNPPADNPPAEDDEIDPAPAPLFKTELPADLEAKFAELDSKEDSLVQQFDDGDITFAEYHKQLRALNRERGALDSAVLKAELAREASATQFEQNWHNSLDTFLASHPEINLDNDIHRTVFDSLLRKETAPVIERGGQIGPREIQKAYDKFVKELNLVPGANNSKSKARDNLVPPTLGKVPAAATNDTDDGRFAHLDRLAESDPLKYEETLERMARTDRAGYEAYMAN